MPNQSIHFKEDLHKLIKDLIEQKTYKSFQHFVDCAIISELKKFGIEEITKLPQYVLKEPYTTSYTKVKEQTPISRRFSQVKEDVRINPYTNEDTVYISEDENEEYKKGPTRARK